MIRRFVMNEKVFLVSIFMFTSSLTHADAVQNKINQLFEELCPKVGDGEIRRRFEVA